MDDVIRRHYGILSHHSEHESSLIHVPAFLVNRLFIYSLTARIRYLVSSVRRVVPLPFYTFFHPVVGILKLIFRRGQGTSNNVLVIRVHT
jgi:hypothetical protein